MKADIVFHDVEVGGPDTEGAYLMAITKEFGDRREVIFLLGFDDLGIEERCKIAEEMARPDFIEKYAALKRQRTSGESRRAE